MKKGIFLIMTGLALTLPASAQTTYWGDVPVYGDSYGHMITRDGVFSTGEAVMVESAWGRNNVTGESYFYEACSIGDGNAVSQDLKVVGTDKMYMKGAFLYSDKDPVLIGSIKKYQESYIHGITWDGTRICGIVSNPNSSGIDEIDPSKMTMMYNPVVCDIDPTTGEAGDPIFLPCPPVDFLNLRPQYCTAVWISDDGKTVLGQVIGNTGYLCYPIVYKEDESGKWSYILPSEPLFNPDNLSLPVWPKPEMDAPQAVDFIGNPELRALFEQLLEEWDGSEEDSPYNLLDPDRDNAGGLSLMTPQEWKDYQLALKDYEIYLNYYQSLIDRYYEEYHAFLAHSSNFLQSSMSMNHDGTMIAQTRLQAYTIDGQNVNYETPVVFNLTDSTYKFIGDDRSELEVNQILPDGTLILHTPKPGPASPDMTPVHSYVIPAGSEKMYELAEYVGLANPEVYTWMQDYLYHDVPIGYTWDGQTEYKSMFVTGLAAVSDDFSAISAGLDAWSWDYETGDYYTYFLTGLTNPQTGVSSVRIEDETDSPVYNLQGVYVGRSLEKLPHGIYIQNGKKIAL